MNPIAQILIGIVLGTVALFGFQQYGMFLPASESGANDNTQQEVIKGLKFDDIITCVLFKNGNSKEMYLLNGAISKGTKFSNDNEQDCQSMGGFKIKLLKPR